jgi:hypothetical protein
MRRTRANTPVIVLLAGYLDTECSPAGAADSGADALGSGRRPPHHDDGRAREVTVRVPARRLVQRRACELAGVCTATTPTPVREITGPQHSAPGGTVRNALSWPRREPAGGHREAPSLLPKRCPHREANLAGICQPCHRIKSAREGRAARGPMPTERRPGESHPGLVR